MIRWIEKEGYDVTYQTDIDTHAIPANLAPGMHKVFLSAGHDEYWSWNMRDVLEQARNRTDRPLSIGFFGGNSTHWQIRLESSGANSDPANAANRTIVAYKGLATDSRSLFSDPLFSDTDMTNNYLVTAYWRNMSDSGTFGTQCPVSVPNCYKLPEDELLGVMTDLSNSTGSGDLEVDASCPTWVTNGISTDPVVFSGLVGYEADRIFNIASYTNRSWYKISNSAFVGKYATTCSNAIYYKMNSNGARVFSAGTIQWAWGLDGFGGNVSFGSTWHVNLYDPNVVIVTRNILSCLKNGGSACGEN